MNGDSARAKIGSNLIIAGISLQLLWFIFFVIVASFFHNRLRQYPTRVILTHPTIQWQKYLASLYFVSAMIVMRSAFRLAEYAEGFTGYLQSHEVFFYMFDSVPMLAVMAWMNWQHPGEISLLLRQQLKSAERGQELV
jgi:hypothetical protein